MNISRWIGCLLFAFSMPQATAMYSPPDDTVPIERLLANLTAQLATEGESASIHGQLGRVYSLAFALDQKVFEVVEERSGYQLYEISPSFSAQAAIPNEEERFRKLILAMQHYEKAIALAPEASTYHLGLAYMNDLASRHTAYLVKVLGGDCSEEGIKTAQRAYEDTAVAHYRKTFELGVSVEAGNAIIRIMSKRPLPSSDLLREFKYIKRTCIDARNGMRMITPIILSLSESKPLVALLDPDRVVLFDLDGQGVREWPWVQPDTAILVWDADGRGDVTNGTQLIGSVTWWLFWETGYEVLQALDDNRDGWLTGAELAGLALWQDANADAVSDPGEVIPIAAAGIAKLAVTSVGETNGMPYNPAGLQRTDGQYLPTYDWIATPHRR